MIVHADTRGEARSGLIRALRRSVVWPVKTNKGLLVRLLRDGDVAAGEPAEAVDLEWMASEPMTATVERRSGDGVWMRLGDATADGSGRLSWQDHDVNAGAHYSYRLKVASEGETRYFGETSVVIPSALAFALQGAQPNPTAGAFTIAVTLPDAAATQLELVDIAGRRVAEREVGSMGAGHHVVDLTGGRSMPAGVYLVRLSRAGGTLTTRISVVR